MSAESLFFESVGTASDADGDDSESNRAEPSKEASSSTEREKVKKATATAHELKSAKFFTLKPTELKIHNLLGAGAHAEVYKAEWTRTFSAGTSCILVAVKKLHGEVSALCRDRETLTYLAEHANLVKCFDATSEPPYLIVTEFCKGGSVFDLLYNSRVQLSAIQKVKILGDVASGMRYLHAQTPCIIHRDLKSSNVLLTKHISSSKQLPCAKVADFGLSTEIVEDHNSLTIGVGTWRWTAPEVFSGDDHDVAPRYDQMADVFSFAMVIYEVIWRMMPYLDRFPDNRIADPRVVLAITSGLRPSLDTPKDKGTAWPDGALEELVELMQRSWTQQSSSRPSFEAMGNVCALDYSGRFYA